MRRLIPILLIAGLLGCAVTEEVQQAYYKFDNGLTVMLRPAGRAEYAVLMVIYDIGGLHDPVDKSGMAHLIEQVYVTAPAGDTPARTADQFMQQYPDGWNAQTGDLYTLVATTFDRKHLEREIKDAAVRMGDLHISESEVQREKERILEELANMYERVPLLVAFNHAREMAVPSPEGMRRGGLPDIVSEITPDEIRTRWDLFYKPVNATIILAGDFDFDEAQGLIRQHFSQIPAGREIPEPSKRALPRTGDVIRMEAEAVTPEATSVACLAYAAPSSTSDSYVPFLVLVARLWSRAIELGVAPGHFPVRYAPLDDPWVAALTDLIHDNDDADLVVRALRDFVSEAIDQELTPDEIAKTKSTFGYALGLTDYTREMLEQNPYAVALGLGRRLQMGIDTHAISERLETLTTEDIRTAGKAVFAPERCATVIATIE